MTGTKLTIHGKQFSLTGQFEDHTHEQITTLIEAAGGSVTRSTGKGTDYVLVGTNARGEAYGAAVLLGHTMICQEDLLRALSGEDVFLEEPERASEDRHSLFGEVRSLLHDAAPSRATWQELTRLLDLCEPAQLEPLAYYIEGHILQWEQAGHMEGLVGSAYDLGDARESKSRSRGIRGELRVAPERWVGEMVRGAFNTKHRLIRALDLTSSGLSSSRICKLLTNPQMNQVEHIALPTSKRLTEHLVKKLCAAPLSNTVRSLHLRCPPEGFHTLSQWFSQHSQGRGALRELDLSGLQSSTCFDFLEAPYFLGIQRLHVHRWDISSLTGRAIPDLERLDISCPDLESVAEYIQHLPRENKLHSLALLGSFDEHWQTLLDIGDLLSVSYPGHLDLLEMHIPKKHFDVLDASERKTFRGSFYKAKLLSSVKTLNIGEIKEVLDLDRLARRFPPLEVQ